MNKERSFEEDKKVNKYKLHIECEKHVGVYYYWTELLSEAKSDLDNEKDKLSFMESEFELEIRKDKEYEGIKVTENSVKAFLNADKGIKKQKQVINRIKKTIYHLENAVKCLEHKKTMLGHLVSLFSMRYYSDPNDKVKKKGDREVDNKIKDDLNNSMRNRK